MQVIHLKYKDNYFNKNRISHKEDKIKLTSVFIRFTRSYIELRLDSDRFTMIYREVSTEGSFPYTSPIDSEYSNLLVLVGKS